MIYLGKSVHLSYVHSDLRDEIQVYQQHCGGENLCVYKGKLLEKETFQFISKRHHGFPFSLTFFLNGIQVNRLSSCCEYKHRKGSRLGGKRGYFGFVCVERSSPCYKCIIAMGLDKNPTSPKPRKQKSIEKREELEKAKGKLRKDRAYMIPRRNEVKGHKTSASVIFSAEEAKTGVEDVRTAIEEMERKGKPGHYAWEDDQENIRKYEYEEDFEVDEEKQDEKANEEGQADDQINGMLKSPLDDEKDNLDPEKESETSSQKVPDADDNVKDEGDGCSESELEEDKQDLKNASSSSSGSHSYSSCSEDESALGNREAHAENSPYDSARSSSSQELSEDDEPGRSHLPTKDSVKIEIEDREMIKANMEIKTLSIEESLENFLEEETEKRTQVIAEGLSKKFRKHVFKEEKENYKSKLWEGSTAKLKGQKAGPHRVEKGVGQMIAEAVEPGCHCPCDTESGVSSPDEGEKHSTKPEIDTGAAPNMNLVVEERETLSSNKESKPVASEVYILKKEEAVEEDEAPQSRDVDTTEEKGGAIPWGKTGVNEVPFREWKRTVEYPVLVEQVTEEIENPWCIAGGAEAETEVEGDRGLDKEGLNPMGKEAVRASAGLKEDEAPADPAMMQVLLETERPASEEEQGLEKAMLVSKAPAQNSECVLEGAALKENMMPKGEAERRAAVSEAGSEKPEVEESKEEASTDLEVMGPEEDSACWGEGGSEEAMLGREKPAQERKAVMATETPLSSSTSEKAEAMQMGFSKDSLGEVCKEDVKRKGVVTEVESNKTNDKKETLPEEFYATKERTESEKPKTPLGVTESETEEVTRASAFQDEDILEEQKLKGEVGQTVKEVRHEEETQGLQTEMECDVESEVPMEASELTEDTGLQEDTLREKEVGMFETAPKFEKSLGNTTALRKEEGGERLRDAADTEHRDREEPRHGEDKKGGPSEQDKGPGPGGEGVLGAPEGDPARKAEAAQPVVTATGEAQECAAKDQDGLAGLERKGKEGSLQGQQGEGVMAMTQGDVPEKGAMMAGKLSEEVMGGDPEEETDKECALRTAVVKNRDTEGDGSLPGGVVVAEEDLHQERGGADMAEEKREMLADSKRAEGKAEANTAFDFSDIPAEKTWHKVDELVGKTAAAEKVAVEEIALSREEVPAVEEVTMIGASVTGMRALREPSNPEGKAPQLWQVPKGGEVGPTQQQTESVGEESGVGSHNEGQGLVQAEEFRPGLSQERESELNRESPDDVKTLPVKPDCTGTQEKQLPTEQRQSGNTDVSMNDMKA